MIKLHARIKITVQLHLFVLKYTLSLFSLVNATHFIINLLKHQIVFLSSLFHFMFALIFFLELPNSTI